MNCQLPHGPVSGRIWCFIPHSRVWEEVESLLAKCAIEPFNPRPDRARFLQLLLQDSQEGWGDQANPQPKFVQQVSHLGQIQHGDSQIHPDN